MSQRTGAGLNRLSCDMTELEFAMEVDTAPLAYDSFSTTEPKIIHLDGENKTL